MRTPLALLVVPLALALPPAALASVSLTSVKLTPSTTDAGAHPDVTIESAFALDPDTDDVKSVGVVLPQGLVGDPNAADRCKQAAFAADTCPVSSKVGTTTASAIVTVVPGLVEVPQDTPGDVYVLEPQGREPARLGIVLRPSAVGAVELPKIFLQSPVTVGPQTGYGLQTVFDGLPRMAGPFAIRLTAMKLVLNGKAAHGTFVTNPTNCRQATTTATVTSYDEPNTPKTGTTSFTPTACDRLPFAPGLSATVGGAGTTKPRTSPTLTTVIAARGGDANAAKVSVTLPGSIGPNASELGRVCDAQTFAAGRCPASARVGTATATSPLLPVPLTGPVVLAGDPVSGFPGLAVQFGEPVPLTLFGQVLLGNASTTNVFDGIPDLPLSRFALTLDGGGNKGVLINVLDLCKPGAAGTARADLVAHSGRTATVTAPLEPQGCESSTASGGKGRPRASLSLRFRRGRGTLTASFKQAAGAPAITRVRLALPKGLSTANLRRGLRAKAGKRKLKGRAVRLRGRTIDLRPGGRGARTVSLRWTGIRPSRSLAKRLKKRPKLRFVARLSDRASKQTTLRLAVRPSAR